MNSGSGGGYVPYPSTEHPIFKIFSQITAVTLPSGCNWLVYSADPDDEGSYPYILDTNFSETNTYFSFSVTETLSSDSYGLYYINNSGSKVYYMVTGGTKIKTPTGGGGSSVFLIKL